MRELRATGLDAVALATRLLQRVRLADPDCGLWEAADVQWWWRTPRASDDSEQTFWVDEDGPLAGILTTEFRGEWQVDFLGACPEDARIATLANLPEGAQVPVRDGDVGLRTLVEGAGLVPVEQDGTAWMAAGDRPAPSVPDGYFLTDRRDDRAPHPMRARNGDAVEERLRACSLYDPGLDLAVKTHDGAVAGYLLYWFDPVTKVGLLEPMRVLDGFQRRGLARAMIAEGLERLAARGAERMKVSYGTDAARALYTGCGYRPASTSTWYGRAREPE